jgi:hypothetical protein
MFFISFGKNPERGRESAGRRKAELPGQKPGYESKAFQKNAMALLGKFEQTGVAKKIMRGLEDSIVRTTLLKAQAEKNLGLMTKAQERRLRGSLLQNLKAQLLYYREMEKFAIGQKAPEAVISYVRNEAGTHERELASFKTGYRTAKAMEVSGLAEKADKRRAGIKAAFIGRNARITDDYRSTQSAKSLREFNQKSALLRELLKNAPSGQNSMQISRLHVELLKDDLDYTRRLKEFARKKNAGHAFLKFLDSHIAQLKSDLEKAKGGQSPFFGQQ